MNLFLIGYRCTGKTTVGRWLADRLGWKFVDSDKEIVNTHGMTIQHIVAAQGWQGFRDKEKRVVERICRQDRQVVATGGGVAVDGDNVVRMRESGVVCWLKALPETIRQRMNNDADTGPLRPSLTSTAADAEVETVLARREPLYEAAADFAVETDRLRPEAVGEKILRIAPPGGWEAGKPGGLKSDSG